MEPNTARAQAERWLGISAKLLASRDLVGSRSFAIRAREVDPTNPISEQILAVVDTLVSAEKRVINSVQHDWYSILQLSHLVRDPDLIASHYRRLVLLLNPEHNQLPFADFALRVVVDAWSVLSDPTKKWIYDSELSIFLQRRSAPPDPEPVRVEASSATYQFFQQPPQQALPPSQQQWSHHFHQQEQPELQERQLFQQQHHPQPQLQPAPPPPQPQTQWLPQTQLVPEQQRPSQPQWLPQPPQTQPRPPLQQPEWLPEQQPPPSQPQGKEPEILPQLRKQHAQQQQKKTPPPPPPPASLQKTPPQQAPQRPPQQPPEQRQTEKNDGSNVTNERATDNSNESGNKTDTDNNHHGGEQSENFWTACPYCYYIYEYAKTFLDCILRCQNCRRAFQAVQIPNVPEPGAGASFCSWGFFPIGVSMTSWKKGMPFGGNANGFGSNWAPMFSCPMPGLKKKAWRIVDEDDDFDVSSDDSDSSDDDWGSTRKKAKKGNGRRGRGRPGKKGNAAREKMTNQHSVEVKGGADGDNSQCAAEMRRNSNHGVSGTKNDVINKTVASGSLRKQTGKGVRGRRRLDLNVEFSNEVEDHTPVTRESNGEEVVGFFEGLDEFLSTLPILHVVGDEKAKPS